VGNVGFHFCFDNLASGVVYSDMELKPLRQLSHISCAKGYHNRAGFSPP
jgi:hypothetical protein